MNTKTLPFLLIIFLSFIALSCGLKKESTHSRLAGKLMEKYSAKLQRENDFFLISIGGSMMEDIKEIGLGYQTYKAVDIEKARPLFVECVAGLLETVQTNKEIQPYLHDDPFTEKNIHFSITFVDRSENYVAPPLVAQISMVKGNIYYSTYDKEVDRLDHLYKEPYEEALRIVKGEQERNAGTPEGHSK